MKHCIIALSLLFWLVPNIGTCANLPLFRISTENSPSHVQTKALKRFANKLRERLGDKLDIQFFDRARLYRGRDVIAALSNGKVEMAAPGTWHASRYAPSVGVFQLPVFYGRTATEVHTIVDGPTGKILNQEIEEATGTVVAGRWIDLGTAHLFGVNTPITNHENLASLRIRVAGGQANEMRIAAFGGVPLNIPWPDLLEHLKQKNVQGLLTTHETIRSAALWEYGVTHAFEDHQYFAQYVPMISRSFWVKLPDKMRQTIKDTWEELADMQRAEAKQAQLSARDLLQIYDVEITTPPTAKLIEWRKRILPAQKDIAEKIGISPSLIEQITNRLSP